MVDAERFNGQGGISNCYGVQQRGFSTRHQKAAGGQVKPCCRSIDGFHLTMTYEALRKLIAHIPLVGERLPGSYHHW